MPSPYIPPKDADLAVWANNFAALITAAPATYGLTAGDASTIQGFVDDFQAALTIALNPATKTAPTVAAKDGAKAAMLEICRLYAQQVRNNIGVSDADKVSLGLTIPDHTPTPIPAPSSNPILGLVGAQPGQQTLRYADSATPDKRGKPFGVLGLQVFVAVGVTAAVSPDDARFKSFVTRQPYGVNFTSGEAGKVATYFARWQSRTGLIGPWSAPVSMIVV